VERDIFDGVGDKMQAQAVFGKGDDGGGEQNGDNDFFQDVR